MTHRCASLTLLTLLQLLRLLRLLSLPPEIDISVSKLLGFKTFANFSKGFGVGEFSLGKKVSVSENLVKEKSLGFGFGKFD